MHLPLLQQGEMGERAQTAIPQEHIAGLQLWMQDGHLRHVVRPQGSGQRLQQKAGAGVEQDQQMRHRKAAARLLHAGLAKLGLQLRRVRHGEAGAIDEKDAMAEPAAILRLHDRLQGLRDVLQQPLEDRQRQACARQ